MDMMDADTLLQWILESDDIEEIHEWINDYFEGAFPLYGKEN